MPKKRSRKKPTKPPGPRPPAPVVSRTRVILLLAGVLLLGATLRIYDLGGRDLWLDEANSVIIAQQNLPELIARLQLDSSPPLYYLILHFWMQLFGNSEVAVRTVSVICGVALVAGVFVVGCRLFSLQTGAIAAVLLSVSPIQILYSQQARMYSLLPLAALLSMYFLWRAVMDKSPRHVLAYGVTTLVSLYVHNYAIYLLPAHALVLVWSGSLRARLRTWLICAACVAASYLPWLPSFLMQLENKSHFSWLMPFWRAWGVFGSLGRTFQSFAPGGRAPPYVGFGGVQFMPWLPTLVCGFLATLSLYWMAARRPERLTFRGPVGMLLSFVCLPLVSALLVSSISTPNYLAGRCDQLVFPGFVLLVAAGLMSFRTAAVRYAFVVALIGYSFAGLAQHYGSGPPDGERALAQAIAQRARPGEAVVCTSLTRASLEYYLARADVPVRFFSYPSDTARHLGNQDDAVLLREPGKLVQEAQLLEEQIRQTCGPEARFFAVVVPARVNAPLADHLLKAQRSRPLERIGRFRQSVSGLPMVALLYQLKPAAQPPPASQP